METALATALAQPSCLSPLPTQAILFLSRKTSHAYPSSPTTHSQGLSASIRCRNLTHEAKATMPQGSGVSTVAEAFDSFEHLLLPITDRNPYLSEGTRQAVATTAALAKKYGADITVIVIDEKTKESLPEHETQLSSIRWHLFEGGYKEFKLLERLGEGSKPTAIIGEVADDMNLDLVILSMEAIHSKHIDANLLISEIPKDDLQGHGGMDE